MAGHAAGVDLPSPCVGSPVGAGRCPMAVPRRPATARGRRFLHDMKAAGTGSWCECLAQHGPVHRLVAEDAGRRACKFASWKRGTPRRGRRLPRRAPTRRRKPARHSGSSAFPVGERVVRAASTGVPPSLVHGLCEHLGMGLGDAPGTAAPGSAPVLRQPAAGRPPIGRRWFELGAERRVEIRVSAWGSSALPAGVPAAVRGAGRARAIAAADSVAPDPARKRRRLSVSSAAKGLTWLIARPLGWGWRRCIGRHRRRCRRPRRRRRATMRSQRFGRRRRIRFQQRAEALPERFAQPGPGAQHADLGIGFGDASEAAGRRSGLRPRAA